jgi:hypothetical protein
MVEPLVEKDARLKMVAEARSPKARAVKISILIAQAKPARFSKQKVVVRREQPEYMSPKATQICQLAQLQSRSAMQWMGGTAVMLQYEAFLAKQLMHIAS